MIKPMLCEPSQPFDSEDYFWEIKWDGERAILIFNNGTMEIQSRKGNIVTHRYPELQELRINHRGVILDGEIVVLDKTGKSNFGMLAQRSHLEKKLDIELRMKKIAVTFVAFDILNIEGESVRKLPLFKRRELLYDAFDPIPGLAMWSPLCGKEGTGKKYFEIAEKQGLEGVVGKHIESPYLDGQRSPYWKKCKVAKSVDLFFTDFTLNPAGIRCVAEDGTVVQVSGRQSFLAMKEIKERGGVWIEVLYRGVTENGKLRQATCKEVK